MAKLIVFNLITLNGFFEGFNGDISWHNVDGEFIEFAIEQLNSIDTIIFGRKTYELMADYWQTQQAIEEDPIVAGKMNSLRKIVISKTLDKAGWNNTRLIKENAEEEISKLKRQNGKDLAIFGSGKLTSEFTKLGLIDEFRVMVNPVVLGNGNPLFKGMKNKIILKLVRTRTFKNGNVLLVYEPVY